MKVAINVILLLVGALFIFSGLIKLNDPVGTQIKLEEYFDVFADDFREKIFVDGNLKESKDTAVSSFFESLKPFALSFAILMSALEVIWGFSLLIRYRPKLTLWSLFLLIVFFTGLTFYSWHYNKVTDCGCFGDAIKLKPFESFLKDVVLLFLIGFLLLQHKKIVPNTQKWALWSNIAVSLFSFGLGFYAAYYLPIIDFLPYKVGNHLPSLMKPKEPLRFENRYIYTNLKTGKDETFTEKEFSELWDKKLSDTTTYKYKDFKQTLLNPEAQAKIGADFRYIDADTTEMNKMFVGKKLLIIVPDIRKTNLEAFKKVSALLKNLKGTDIMPIGLSSDKAQMEILCHEYQLPMEHHAMDSKILKAMIRTNPGIMLLENGTVRKKWSYLQVPEKI
ncbi:MAG: DoxX family protein [Raineya sp.]|nr:DoxX family protein [Raineya sp.]